MYMSLDKDSRICSISVNRINIPLSKLFNNRMVIVYHYNGKMSLKQLFEDDFPLFSISDKNHMTVEDVATDAVRHKCHWIDTRVHSSSESPTLFYEVASRSDRCEGKRIQGDRNNGAGQY